MSQIDPEDVAELLRQMSQDGDYVVHQVGKQDVEFRLPPDMRDAKVDMSHVHFMDHSVWACRQGRAQHLRFMWQFMWKMNFQRKTLCRIGRHAPTSVFKMRSGKPEYVQAMCSRCHKIMGAKQPL